MLTEVTVEKISEFHFQQKPKFWVEVSNTYYHSTPPEMIPLEEIESWIQSQPKESDLYASMFRYISEDPY